MERRPAVAQRFLAAVRAAHISGDRAIGANILGFMGVQPAVERASPGDAVTLTESALRAERELTPAVAGSLYGRLAVGAAHTGDATASQRAQDRAFELLGRSGEAEPHLRRAVGLLGPGLRRDRALWLCDLASARLADFRAAATPYARSAAVREFDAKHRDLVSASLA